MTELAGISVSRETIERLQSFSRLVEKWNPKINLISKASLPDIWDRHIVDSIQLYALAPKEVVWVDIGSGGGFPGIIIAILASEHASDDKITLVESDVRKCAFLRTAIRELNLDAVVISNRVENIPSLQADILSARALSDLNKLLGFAEIHLKPNGMAIFPKGETWKKEHSEAQQLWSYHHEPIKSITNPSAAILKIKDISRV